VITSFVTGDERRQGTKQRPGGAGDSGVISRAGNEIATRESLERERQMIRMVDQRLGQLMPLTWKLEDFKVSLHLIGEQKKVIEFLLNSRDRCVNIQGAAGTARQQL
jgi:hypothetical protein